MIVFGTVKEGGALGVNRGTLALMLLVYFFLVVFGTRFAVADDHPRQLILALPVLLYFIVRGSRESGGNILLAPLVLFCLWCFASALWSENPVVTMSASAMSLIAVAVCWLAARTMGASDVLRALLIASLAVCSTSLVLGFVQPEYAVVADGYQSGSLRGIFTHRNQLAYVATIGVICSFVAWEFRVYARILSFGSLLVCSFVLVWASSMTALLVSVTGLLLVVCMRGMSRIAVSRRWIPVNLMLVFLIPLGVVGALNSSDLLASLGRDISLTGRTDVWEAVTSLWSQSPWLGHGWGSVWLESSPSQWEVSSSLGFRLFHAHSAYLDALVQVGVVGFGLLLTAIAVTLASAISLAKKNLAHELAFVLGVCVLFSVLASSSSESRLTQALGLGLLALSTGAVARLAIASKASA